MDNQKKTLQFSIMGIGDMSIDVLQVGNEMWLREIEKFITQSESSFVSLAMSRNELKGERNFEMALQLFVTHIQTGGEQQNATQIRKHYRNWIVSHNGSLKKIIEDGHKSNNGGNSAKGGTSTDRMETARKW